MNLKNLFLAGGLATIIGVSSFKQPFMHAEAALTAPTSWTFKYTNQDFPGYKLRSQTDVISTPTYTRTVDGAYYNYSSTFTITTGLTATQTFNRSNTSWYSTGTDYIPNDTKIGSNTSVGTIINKILVGFNNQTKNNYLLYLDISSSPNGTYLDFDIDTTDINQYYGNVYFEPATTQLFSIYIPAYTNVVVSGTSVSLARYIDAWYLQDLGVSAAYQAGVDDGIIQGEQSADSTVLLDAVETVVGVAINFILMIMTFSIFDISLLNIALVLVAILGIVWILKALRG